jgi:dolichol kinase
MLREIRAELARKSIHILIAMVPGLAAINLSNTALLLMSGILFYTWAESMRFLGFSIPAVSYVTKSLLRTREQKRFALGPVTLGLGALLSLLIFPFNVATAAIYALAFGDSAAGLVGKFLGRFRPAFLAGKSLEGSLACFTVAFFAGFLVFGEWKISIAVGIGSMLADALPIKDFDNLLLPLIAGLCALAFL